MKAASPSSSLPVQLTCTGVASVTAAGQMRRVMQTWLAEVTNQASVDTSHIVLGVYEALANCAEHAYSAHRVVGTMKLQANFDADARSLSVCVSDRGSWRTPACHDYDDPQASRGITLMDALADHCTITTRRDGTTVCLDYNIAPQAGGEATARGSVPVPGRRPNNRGCNFIAV